MHITLLDSVMTKKQRGKISNGNRTIGDTDIGVTRYKYMNWPQTSGQDLKGYIKLTHSQFRTKKKKR